MYWTQKRTQSESIHSTISTEEKLRQASYIYSVLKYKIYYPLMYNKLENLLGGGGWWLNGHSCYVARVVPLIKYAQNNTSEYFDA